MKSETYKCPRDGTPLQAGSCFGVKLFRCQECHGILIRQKLVRPLLREMSKDLVIRIPLDYPIEPTPDKGAGIACPICSSPTENFGYMGCNFAILDCCHKCRVLWIDTQELGTMSIQYAKTQRRSDQMQLDEKINHLEFLQRSIAVDLARATENSIIHGFRGGIALGDILDQEGY
jgi:Zn-finger nucleic acid-binding protein